MTPQVKTLLIHLQKHGSISQAEAGTVYKIRALPRRIADLKALGHKITSKIKKDPTGQRYARYTLIPSPKVGDRVRVVSQGFHSESQIGNPYYYLIGDTGTVTTVLSDSLIVNLDISNRPLKRPFVCLQDVEVISND